MSSPSPHVSKHPKISACMNNLLEQYKLLRGKPKDVPGFPFWDMVVITASDVAQQTAYQQQIDDKTARGELPTDLPIHVISDPLGVRIGNGGSTLTCLESLHQKYGDTLFEYKILLIHAGGWSQRMPSASALGKVFSVLPHGEPPFQMLDLKLALYRPFVDRIQPGVFIVCADDFVVFDLGEDESWKIPGQGFTALAHPAPLEVGKSHGVFVLADPETMDTSQTVKVCECLKVLQKPSEARMKEEGAPLKGNCFSFGDGIKLEGDVVYTDSCFYFGTDVMKKLIELKTSIGTISCEIDAYGDFLQAVGKMATNDYIGLTSNVSQPTPNLLEMRQKVFDFLNGLDIHILVMNSSKFIHIGTTKELLQHFCQDYEFQDQLCMGKNVFNLLGKESDSCEPPNRTQRVEEGENKDRVDNGKHCGISEKACMVHCSLAAESKVGSDCFMEFCQFEVPVTIDNNCIISNCRVSSSESKAKSLSIPSHSFLHTVPINPSGSGDADTEYVTIFFHTEDNLKKTSSVKELGDLPFLCSTLGNFLSHQGIDFEYALPTSSAGNCIKNGSKSLDGAGRESGSQSSKLNQKVSLWNLKLYPAYTSMTASLEESLAMITNDNSSSKSKKLKRSHKLYSMAELLQVKNVAAMLEFRRKLFQRIMSLRH